MALICANTAFQTAAKRQAIPKGPTDLTRSSAAVYGLIPRNSILPKDKFEILPVFGVCAFMVTSGRGTLLYCGFFEIRLLDSIVWILGIVEHLVSMYCEWICMHTGLLASAQPTSYHSYCGHGSTQAYNYSNQ